MKKNYVWLLEMRSDKDYSVWHPLLFGVDGFIGFETRQAARCAIELATCSGLLRAKKYIKAEDKRKNQK